MQEQGSAPTWPPIDNGPRPLATPGPLSPVLSTNHQVKLYPDIALGALRREQVAVARIWLLLQHIDEGGCGWVEIGLARQKLSKKGEALKVCGWRQLRKLLARGDDLFWLRSKGRIWIRSAAKVAASLQVFRLSGSPVSLPVEALLQPIGTVRAHFYASFHSGRTRDTTARTFSKPITRATLQRLSHLDRRTQRNYEKRIAVRKQHNFAVGERITIREYQARAWQHGSAIFCFTDHLGGLGRKGNRYIAWQLPNSYLGPHAKCSRGRQKRINRELADLFWKGMTGNDKHPIADSRHQGKCFYENGFSAAAGFNRLPGYDAYWRSHSGNRGHYQVWHLLAAQEDN